MTPAWKPALESQFVAALDMLENAIRACPDRVWNDGATPVARRFWYLVFHTLFWLDFYLSGSEAGFAPPEPFTLGEMDPAGIYPERAYARSELLAYLAHGRKKLHRALASLAEADATGRCGFQAREMSVLELHLYNLRHVQHHVAQLNFVLRERTDSAPGWVGRGRLAPGE
jgi:hypothetical protein